ncbi:pol polyprotein [Nephila pilipes]|uniref:Pol polyprotein n=1 Tax=Nephila pilipes TaxID=299642 RepID=A0A8X6PCC4_NEPPI|nr:pol polyprotein [Nephila pilipes]
MQFRFVSPAKQRAVERFHRQLKRALISHLPDSWLDALSLVLLGIQTIYKDNMVASSEELVYGTRLKFHKEFFSSSLSNARSLEFLRSLRRRVSSLKPAPASHYSSCPVFTSKDLFHLSCIFLRLDRVRRPLEPPYAGAYKVVKRTSKVFTLEIDGKQHSVSLDRLKPAHLLPDTVNKETPSFSFFCCRLSI